MENLKREVHTLPETLNLLSVFMVAECIPSDTRRTRSLPSTALKTLGKKNTRQNQRFAECQAKNTRQRGVCRVFFFALGKEIIFFLKKKEKKNFVECPDLGHSAKEKIT